MAGFNRNTAVLDACVLYPAPLRDMLVSLAAGDVFGAKWTNQIQDEWIRNVCANRPDLNPQLLERTKLMMSSAVEDCLIQNFEYLIDSLALPDLDDRHVLAAAIVGHADAIVTFNLKDFPDPIVSAHGIEVLHPDDFLVAQYDLNPAKFLGTILGTIKKLRSRLRSPIRTSDELIAIYEQQRLPQVCKKLRAASELI